MGPVVLLLQLFAGEDGLVGVDDDDVVAAVNMRGVVGLELAAKQISGEGSRLAHGLAGGIKNVPLAGRSGLLLGYQGSRHVLPPKITKCFDNFRATGNGASPERASSLYHKAAGLSTENFSNKLKSL